MFIGAYYIPDIMLGIEGIRVSKVLPSSSLYIFQWGRQAIGIKNEIITGLQRKQSLRDIQVL